MLYLLDANVIIDADRDYYPLARVPEFWAWLANQAELGVVKMPRETYEEAREGTGDLSDWLRRDDGGRSLLLDEEPEPHLVARAVAEGYAEDLDDSELQSIGNDAFLIAYAMADVANRCIVTTEVSKPKKTRANRHVPDVCKDLGICCRHTYQFIRDLDFTTSWDE